MFIGHVAVAIVSYLIEIALFIMILVAFATAFMHPSDDFTDKGTKALWVAAFGIGVLVGIDYVFFRIFVFIPGFIRTIVFWGCAFAAIYFLSIEHPRMGRSGGFTWKEFVDRRKPDGGNSNNSRGSW